MTGELPQDEPLTAVERDFEVTIHNIIMDTVTQSIHEHFAVSGKLCSDFACLDPKNFPEVRNKGLPGYAMQNLSLMKFDARATTGTLKAERASPSHTVGKIKAVPPRGVQGADLRRR